MSEEALPDFASVIAFERPTEIGGTVKVGIGGLFFPDGREEPAVAIRITRPGAPVTEFAMLMPTFGVLLECMMDAFREAQERAAAPQAGDDA